LGCSMTGSPKIRSSRPLVRELQNNLRAELTLEERRERRRLRREKQREDNVHRAAKMLRLGLKSNEFEDDSRTQGITPNRMLRLALLAMTNLSYAEVPQPDWFKHYLKRFDTVEINAPFLLMAYGCERPIVANEKFASSAQTEVTRSISVKRSALRERAYRVQAALSMSARRARCSLIMPRASFATFAWSRLSGALR
jgi:hypothetical protein